MHKVTIVIPTYNGEKYIGETIESCINQTYANIKIVVVDDHSSDNTLEVLKHYQKQIVIICNKENQGLPKNINKVILKDDSKYFIYLGHDDLLPPDHIEKMVAEFTENTVAVHCNSIVIDENGEGNEYSRDDSEQLNKTKDIDFQLSLNNFISIIGMMHCTKSFQKIAGWDEVYTLYGEWLYYCRILNCGIIKYSQKTYAYYRKHNTNISKTLYDSNKIYSFLKYKIRCKRCAYARAKLSIMQKLYFYICFLPDILRLFKCAVHKNFKLKK